MTHAGLDVTAVLTERGAARDDEVVTQLQHALQCAALARRERADDDVVLAALLHDIGHLVAGAAGLTDDDDRPARHHGHTGAALVRPFVPPRVAWLIEHHVVAKRYLCTVDPLYVRCLSVASTRSLLVQGGRLTAEEQASLEAEPWFVDAVRIRLWDDRAKDPGAIVAPLGEYAWLLDRYFAPQPAGVDR
jgi:predicted HD phosphohydrolase